MREVVVVMRGERGGGGDGGDGGIYQHLSRVSHILTHLARIFFALFILWVNISCV